MLIATHIPIHNMKLYTQQSTFLKFYSPLTKDIHVIFYSLISSPPSSKPPAFSWTEKDAASQDVHSQQQTEIAQLNWTRSSSNI